MSKLFTSPVKIAASLIVFANMIGGTPTCAQDMLAPQEFARKAAMSNTFEIEASKLALERGQDPAARAFARDMVADHEEAGIALERAASEDGVQLPSGLDAQHVKKLEALQSSSEQDFDQAYLSTQQIAHEEAVSLFDRYSRDSKGGALKTFAEKTLGTLRAHNVRIHGLSNK